MISIPRARRTAAALVVAAGLVLVPAATAHAHVTVSSPDATPGGFGKLVFRVPSESDTANTTAVSIELPAATPFAFVSVGSVPGWTAETVTSPLPEPLEVEGFTLTEAVTRVTWTAVDGGLAPHEFTEFALSAGPFPSGVDELVFPAAQTYSDGEVVEWAEPVVDGEPEPGRPAPVLELGAADGAGAGDGSGSDTVARVLAVAGLAVGAAGLAFGVTARRRPRPAA